MADTFARQRQLIGTTAEWAANDLVIGLGELALERLAAGAVRLKIGDGVNRFSALAYFDPGVFDFVLKAGDTMTGPLILPALHVNADGAIVEGGLEVSGGPSSFDAPVDLGAAASVDDPPPADNDLSVPNTRWVQARIAGIISGLHLKGTWNAATNVPALVSGGGGANPAVRGDFYIVAVAGSTNLDGITTWEAGDNAVFNGVAWQRVPNTLSYEQVVAALGYTPLDQAGDELLGPLEQTATGNAVDQRTFRQTVMPDGSLRFSAMSDANVEQGWLQIARDGTVTSSQPPAPPPFLTGEIRDLVGILTTAPTGWVLSMQGTIGNGASGATIRANADCRALFAHMWTLSNTDAPVLPGGRGASADADFDAGKTIGGLDFRGAVRATFDALGGTPAGRLSNIPRSGQTAGAQSHTLTEAELANHGHGPGSLLVPAHSHGVLRGAGVPSVTTPRGVFGDGNAASVSGSTENAGPWGLTGSTNTTGGNAAHNNVQPTRTVTTIIKL